MEIKYIQTFNNPNFDLFPELNYSFGFKRRFNINEIKIDKSLFSFNNPIIKDTIDKILYNFQIDFWDPIMINEDWFLLDWQHRLEFCRIKWIEFIDVIINKNGKKN